MSQMTLFICFKSDICFKLSWVILLQLLLQYKFYGRQLRPRTTWREIIQTKRNIMTSWQEIKGTKKSPRRISCQREIVFVVNSKTLLVYKRNVKKLSRRSDILLLFTVLLLNLFNVLQKQVLQSNVYYWVEAAYCNHFS